MRHKSMLDDRSRVVVLMLSSMLTMLTPFVLCHCGQESPPEDRASEMAMFDPQATSTQTGIELTLTLDSWPPSLGPNTGEIFVYRASDGSGVSGAAVSLNVFMPSMGHGSTERPVITDVGDGTYRLSRVTFSMRGRWRLTATARSGDESAEVVQEYDVR